MAVVLGTGFDAGAVYSSEQNQGDGLAGRPGDVTPAQALNRFHDFIREFRDESVYIYRERLSQAFSLGTNVLDIDLDDLRAYDDTLSDRLEKKPSEYMPVFEEAVQRAVQQLPTIGEQRSVPAFQVTLRSSATPLMLRNLMAVNITNMVVIRGIVISASKTRAKATKIAVRCKTCGDMQDLSVRAGFGGATFPRNCLRERQPGADNCGLDPYSIVADKSKYADHQTLKLQEAPEDVPTGEMPRQVLLSVDRSLVNLVVPGTRVRVVGVFSIFQRGGRGSRRGGNSSLPSPYIRVVGLQTDNAGVGRATTSFRPDEVETFKALARDPEIKDKIARSIDPAIYGHEDIKRAIACLLFSGARKVLPDGMRLRGDINVLLLGDPGTAKSQFLKFVEKVAPIAVYTSGKGSSAAGLTASVVRDPSTREFYLEGGAMVLADGGVVCIDEFDKMRDNDRVAIHEAMEQQTISIAKAGITTILNSRTSVLAAANPVFGRYDGDLSAAEQIDFQGTILSRFDLIFIVRDVKDVERDQRIASHVLKIHRSGGADPNGGVATASINTGDDDDDVDGEIEGTINLTLLKKYVSYARTHVSPRLTEKAATSLANRYVKMRSDVRQAQLESEADMPTIPITVRQLEAIARIAESQAKMQLRRDATEDDVDEAFRLFTVATLKAAQSGVMVEGAGSAERAEELARIEGLVKRRLAIGHNTSEQKMVDDFVDNGLPEYAVRKCLSMMVQRGELRYYNNRRSIRRVR